MRCWRLLEVLALEADLSSGVGLFRYSSIRRACGLNPVCAVRVVDWPGLSKHAVVLLAGMNILNLGLNAWLGLGLGWGLRALPGAV